ncbi:ThiJ/PfpI family protein [Xylariales sp. PMI_506]|nr:ThiJ/PfpI family protein [Xylariales sp. PMI_506]
MGKETTIRIGVFIPNEVQLLDAACIDTIGVMGHDYLTRLQGFLPQAVIDLAPTIKICWIGTVQAGEPIGLTSNHTILATHHYSDPEVAPGQLLAVAVPGPFLDVDYSNQREALQWLKQQSETEGTDILSICSGIIVCGEAGLLKDKTITCPRGLNDWIKTKNYGEKEVVADKYRWFQDGSFWSSGGVTNGNDLVAAWARQNKTFPEPLAEIACQATDVGDRDQVYKTPPGQF